MRISDWSSDVCSSDLDLSLGFVSAGFGLSGGGDEDTDGSEAITSVTVTIDAGTLELGAGAPGGSSLSLAGGVYTLIVANPDDYADAIAALQVEVPAGYEGTVNGTISVTTAEDTLSGVENDLTDNSKTITKDFSATVNGDPIDPSAAIGLPQGTTAIKEDSVDNVVKFSASADNLTDELTSIVIELPNVSTGDLDIAQITADLGGNGTAVFSQDGTTAKITITFTDASDVQSFNSSFTLDAPDEDSDVDLTGVKITANAKDITSGVTGDASQTTTIVVDAVLDEAGSATQGMAPSETESANAQEIDLDLSLGFVSPGFGLSGAGGEDTDGSEIGSCPLDGPEGYGDVDLTGVKITANSKDITSGVTGDASQTTTIVVDAVLDEAGSATQGMAPSETESANAQEIDLDLSLGFVSPGFGLSGAGGEDTDGSEAITSVTVTFDAGTLELGAGAPAGSSLIDNGGGS